MATSPGGVHIFETGSPRVETPDLDQDLIARSRLIRGRQGRLRGWIFPGSGRELLNAAA